MTTKNELILILKEQTKQISDLIGKSGYTFVYAKGILPNIGDHYKYQSMHFYVGDSEDMGWKRWLQVEVKYGVEGLKVFNEENWRYRLARTYSKKEIEIFHRELDNQLNYLKTLKNPQLNDKWINYKNPIYIR